MCKMRLKHFRSLGVTFTVAVRQHKVRVRFPFQVKKFDQFVKWEQNTDANPDPEMTQYI